MEWTTLKKYISPICMFDTHLVNLQWTVDACTKIILGR